MTKELQNVDKRCTFSSLVSNYNHLYAINDNSKTTLMCGTGNCIRSRCLCGLISRVILGPTNKHDLIQVAVPHTHVVFPLSLCDNMYISV